MERWEENEDLKIIKVEKAKVQKKMTSWVSSSFDDFATSFSQPTKTKVSQSLNSRPSLHTKSNDAPANHRGKALSQTLFPITAKNAISCKRPRLDSLTKISESALSSNLLVEVYSPSKRIDLAVHKKKVEEISDWLTQKLTKKSKEAPILVLTGPPGAGKTACVQVLCQEMGVSLQQWENVTNQLSGEDFANSAQQERSKVDVYTSQSQATQFNNFLLRANKYSPLVGLGFSDTQGDSHMKSNKKTVILVEEIPNVFHRDTAQLDTILRKYHHSGQCPLVFIVTESNSANNSMQKLFPKDLQNDLHISHINVNPVAPTMMIKCLNRVISLTSGQKNFFAPSPCVLEMIAQGSAGDLRAALNMLQFASSKNDSVTLNELQESGKKMQKRSSVSSKHKSRFNKGKSFSSASEESQSVVGVKDTSVFLFHAVGKILYFKRGNPVEFPDHPKLPAHLSTHERDPLLLDPEEVVSKVHISPDFFSSFLHENYVNFITSVEDLEKVSEYFSDADSISALWTGKEVLENYSVSITTRGFIHSNSAMSRYDSVRKNQGWRPLHKSQWFPTTKQATQNVLSARQLFRGCHWEPEILCTELIPFIHFTNPTLHDPGQISLVHQLTQFSGRTNTFRSRVEQLNEKDAVEEEEEDEQPSKTIQGVWDQRGKKEEVKRDSGSANGNQGVDEDMWGSDWEADDEDLLGSQNKVNVVSEDDLVDFAIEEFDD